MQKDSTINLVTYLTDNNQHIIKVVDEACGIVMELAIREAEPVDVLVQKLTARGRNARTKLEKI